MRKSFLMLSGLLFSYFGYAQPLTTLTLPQAQELARKEYPVQKDLELIRESASASIATLNRAYLPQLSLNGQATWQSDVTTLPIKLPGINVETLDKDQYKVTAEASQLLFDGGVIQKQKHLQAINALAESEKTEATLHQVKQTVNQYYLALLSANEQLEQNALVQKDIDAGLKRIEAQVKNGVAFRSNLATMQAESLKNNQRKNEIIAAKAGILQALTLLLHVELNEQTQLEMPLVEEPTQPTSISRHELRYFQFQDSLLHTQLKLSNAKNLPRFSLFGQLGYGKPGLNQLENEPTTFYIGGIRMNWPLGGFYSMGKENRLSKIQRERLNAQKEVFNLNTSVAASQQREQINKLKKLLADDSEIIRLRDEVKKAATAQLENNVITSADYLREVNAADQARISKIQHEIQLKEAQLTYLNIIGQ